VSQQSSSTLRFMQGLQLGMLSRMGGIQFPDPIPDPIS
jgi:hypothetical protein